MHTTASTYVAKKSLFRLCTEKYSFLVPNVLATCTCASSKYRIAGIFRGYKFSAFRKVFADLIFVELGVFAACMQY